MKKITKILFYSILVILILLFCVLFPFYYIRNKEGLPIPKNKIYTGNELLDLFNIYQGQQDPTGGCVNYNYFQSLPNDLCRSENNMFYLATAGAQLPSTAHSILSNIPIPSVRIYSKQLFNGGLFSFYIRHLPSGNGTWPAIWFSQDSYQKLPNGNYGDWPKTGEFDWIEQVNDSIFNQSTMHIDGYTTNGLCPYVCQFNKGPCGGCLCPDDCQNNCGSDFCPFTCTPELTGQKTDDCNLHCTTFGSNPGCGMKAPDNTFGKNFNESYPDGAVFSVDWKKISNSKSILRCYFIPDKDMINNNNYGPFSSFPDPSKWLSYQYAMFDFSKCDCPFYDAQLILNITLCGAWAGNVFDQSGEKGNQACIKFVSTPGNLKDAYFEISHFAYQEMISS